MIPLPDLIKPVQRKFSLDADGVAGRDTWSAIYVALIGPLPVEAPAPIAEAAASGQAAAGRTGREAPSTAGLDVTGLDPRTIRNLATLHPRAQPVAADFMRLARKIADVRIIDGSRTYSEQDAIYAQGRTKPGPRVTNAPGGYSNHNFALAFDIGVFDEAGKYLDDSPIYRQLAPIGKGQGLSWGGDWRNPVDEPHYEFRPAWALHLSEQEMITELRRRHTAGIDQFV